MIVARCSYAEASCVGSESNGKQTGNPAMPSNVSKQADNAAAGEQIYFAGHTSL
jgi:hypothetical protein